jgi:hypothetical protein
VAWQAGIIDATERAKDLVKGFPKNGASGYAGRR